MIGSVFVDELEFTLKVLKEDFLIFNFGDEVFEEDFPLGAGAVDFSVVTVDDVLGIELFLIRDIIFRAETNPI